MKEAKLTKFKHSRRQVWLKTKILYDWIFSAGKQKLLFIIKSKIQSIVYIAG